MAGEPTYQSDIQLHHVDVIGRLYACTPVMAGS